MDQPLLTARGPDSLSWIQTVNFLGVEIPCIPAWSTWQKKTKQTNKKLPNQVSSGEQAKLSNWLTYFLTRVIPSADCKTFSCWDTGLPAFLAGKIKWWGWEIRVSLSLLCSQWCAVLEEGWKLNIILYTELPNVPDNTCGIGLLL